MILYGHANDETPEEQSAEIQRYRDELLPHVRKDISLRVAVTVQRTHEKIIVTDAADCMVGSWNVCSSNPGSRHFEASLTVKSTGIASELCSVLEQVGGQDASEFINSLRLSLARTNGLKGHPLEERIKSLGHFANLLVAEADDASAVQGWRSWRIQLRGLRDLIWTHFDSPKIAVVRSESIRDTLVEQIRSSSHSILLSSDRVNYNGLDASLVKHLFEKDRLVRVVWGMESPEWDMSGEQKVQEELDIAAQTLRAVAKHHGEHLLTELRPMLNHSKVLIVDEARLLVGSDNFLARGSEPSETSSREIGLIVESPLLARKLLGQLMLHSEAIIGPLRLNTRAGQPWDLFELIRQTIEELKCDKQLKNPGRPDLVSFGVKSRFREFSLDGTIVGEREGEYRPIDKSLSDRWEACMERFGKKKGGDRVGYVLPLCEEDMLECAAEMTGIQLAWHKKEGTYVVQPRSRGTPILIPWFLREERKSAEPSNNSPPPSEAQEAESSEREERMYNLRIGREKNDSWSN